MLNLINVVLAVTTINAQELCELSVDKLAKFDVAKNEIVSFEGTIAHIQAMSDTLTLVIVKLNSRDIYRLTLKPTKKFSVSICNVNASFIIPTTNFSGKLGGEVDIGAFFEGWERKGCDTTKPNQKLCHINFMTTTIAPLPAPTPVKQF